jgi:dienelactone hydrolase
MMMRTRILLAVAFVLVRCAAAAEPDRIGRSPSLPETTPWDLEALSKPPAFRWEDKKSPVRSLVYVGEPYRGRPTSVFAYYATPGTLANDTSGDRKLPAVVLVHGGGGTAFLEWAELWARRGYAAIAMDLAGRRPAPPEVEASGQKGKPARDRLQQLRQRLPDGGPDQNPPDKYGSMDQPVTQHWCYHAVCNVILAHSLIRSFDEVDRSRTAITGISWGGYLTWIAASLDHRFRAAVPVYGCGFLHENSSMKRPIDLLPHDQRQRWIRLYDPSRYISACRVPVFYLNGTNDAAYPLDSAMSTYRLLNAPKNIRIQINMPHSHRAGWAPTEVGRFIDERLGVDGAKALPALRPAVVKGDSAQAEFEAAAPVAQAGLHYTTSGGSFRDRQWKSIDATIQGGSVRAPAAPRNATAWFFTITDQQGGTVSSEVVLGASR